MKKISDFKDKKTKEKEKTKIEATSNQLVEITGSFPEGGEDGIIAAICLVVPILAVAIDLSGVEGVAFAKNPLDKTQTKIYIAAPKGHPYAAETQRKISHMFCIVENLINTIFRCEIQSIEFKTKGLTSVSNLGRVELTAKGVSKDFADFLKDKKESKTKLSIVDNINSKKVIH